MKLTRKQLRQIIAEAIILEEEWSAKDSIRTLQNRINNLEAMVDHLMKNISKGKIADVAAALKGKV
jgi:hypothetical protein